MIDVILELDVPKGCAVKCFENLPAKVKVIDSRPYKEKGVKSLFEVESSSCIDAVIAEIKKNPSLYKGGIDKTSQGKAKGTVAVSHCFPARSIIESGFFISSAAMKNDRMEWRLVGEREALKTLSETLEEQGFDFKLKKVGKIDGGEMLTQKEEQIIKEAFSRGYFDTPKRVGVRGLAKDFGISISTLSEILRKGQKKILRSFFKE